MRTAAVFLFLLFIPFSAYAKEAEAPVAVEMPEVADAAPVVNAPGKEGAVAALPAESEDHALEGANLASDWLTDLDNENFLLAAKKFHPFEDGIGLNEAEKRLVSLRKDTGGLSERIFLNSFIFAIANDNSECRVRVRYLTQFKHKKAVEVVELLFVHDGRNPVVTGYRLEAPEE